jgi:hypothetical protein
MKGRKEGGKERRKEGRREGKKEGRNFVDRLAVMTNNFFPIFLDVQSVK